MSEVDDTNSEAVDSPFETVDVDVSTGQRRSLEYKFIAECPFDHENPDEYTVTATYRSQGEAIEVDSFGDWLDGFEEREIDAETLASTIYDALRDRFGRSNAEVTLYQRNERGVTVTVEMGSCA